MNPELDRRTFLKRAGQASGLVLAGGALETILAACGGNVSTTTGSTPTPGATTVASAGLKSPGNLQWGADYVSGAPYVFKDPSNPNKLVGFEEEIAIAMAALMGGIQQTQVEVCYANLEQALLAKQVDMVMNGWEKTSDREKTELFSDPYYRYGQQVIVRRDDTRFANVVPKTVADLEGYTVGTGSGYKAESIMLADKKINVKSYTGNIPYTDLVQKKIDAFFLDFPIATYYISGAGPGANPIPELKLLGDPIYIDDYFVGFNKSNPNASILLPEINQAIAILKKNGTLKKIYTKWQLQNAFQAQIGVM
jgi:polar amino acid transport system substrate-binding protein